MSFEIWPPVPPEELQARLDETQKRELDWIVSETLDVLRELKHGLDDCYALLAPIDPGSTLVMSTPRHETVKGTITRVGARIVRGALNLQFRTLPPQTISLNPDRPIHIAALAAIHTNLTRCIDLAAILLSQPAPPGPASLSAQMRVLAYALAESTALLKGAPDPSSGARPAHPAHPARPPRPQTAAAAVMADPDPDPGTEPDPSVPPPPPAWTTASSPPVHFSPPLPPSISFYICLQDSCIVLWLRSLEPARVPVNLGTKLGLVIGTVRRIDHDEMDVVFRYSLEGEGGGGDAAKGQGMAGRRRKGPSSDGVRAGADGADGSEATEVYVREKVRVETADPSLMSLYAKLGSLSNSLAQARENLAAVMGEDSDAESNSHS